MCRDLGAQSIKVPEILNASSLSNLFILEDAIGVSVTHWKKEEEEEEEEEEASLSSAKQTMHATNTLEQTHYFLDINDKWTWIHEFSIS